MSFGLLNPITWLNWSMLFGAISGYQGASQAYIGAAQRNKTNMYKFARSEKDLRGSMMSQGVPWQISERNTIFLLESARNQEGFVGDIGIVETTLTIAAANKMRVESLQDISAGVAAVSTDDATFPLWNLSQKDILMTSASPFVAIPFVYLLEQGEAFAAQNNNSGLYLETIVLGCGIKDYIIALLPALTAKKVPGETLFSLHYVLNHEKLTNNFSVKYQELEISNDEIPVLGRGIVVIGKADQVVSHYEIRASAYSQVRRGF